PPLSPLALHDALPFYSCSPAVIEASPLSCPTLSTIPAASTVPSAGSSSWNFSEEEPELMTRMRAAAGSAMGCSWSCGRERGSAGGRGGGVGLRLDRGDDHGVEDRKSTRLNSSHVSISY